MWGLPLGFLMGWIGSVPLAGPVAVLTFQRGMTGRYREGFLLVAGASLMEMVYCAGAVTGHDYLVSRWPHLKLVLEGLGALIMVALGIYFLLVRQTPRAEEAPIENGRRRGVKRHLLLGFSLVALNPTILINWSAALAALDAAGVHLTGSGQSLSFVFGVGLGIVGWFGLVLALFHRIGHRFPFHAFDRSLRVLGGVLVAGGLLAGIKLFV